MSEQTEIVVKYMEIGYCFFLYTIIYNHKTDYIFIEMKTIFFSMRILYITAYLSQRWKQELEEQSV